MPRYVALLRAINVGGRIVKMDELRAQFEALRFGRVESVIASGNILFDSRSTDTAALEARIEKQLRSAFGYEVGTFVRTVEELQAAIAHRPFRASDPVVEGHTLHVIFFRSLLDTAAHARLAALCGAYDDFEAVGRELYWRTRGRSSDSKITGPMLAKALGGMTGTARNITTVRKLAERMTREA
jgi:uncharacterized protein (DUF1697 family)